MRIAYCINGTYNSGGMERVLANKANFLVKRGCEVIIITTDQKGRAPFFALSPKIQCYDLGVNYDENNGKGFINKVWHYPFKQWKHKKSLTKLLDHLRTDIVVSMFGNDVPFIWKIKDGSKKVLEIHFSRFKRLQYGRKGIWKWADAFRNRADGRIVKKFDKFVVLTHEDQAYWGDLPNMIVIENAKNEWGDHKALLESKNVIAVGRYNYQKGFDRLIEAWRLVHIRFPDWKLQIVGDGELRSELEMLVGKYNLEGAVVLKKNTSDILSEYLDASLLVLSSRYEGLPMVLLEAMSVGLPMVAFTCKCGPRDLITDGENGFLVPEGDVPELAAQIMQLMEDSALRKEMGEVARIGSERFSEPVIMEKWMQLFDNLIKRKR
ncbi:MAG: glycosyltransferase family 4 protein [Bacteroidales bacterium]|nr:glycosyltransferase family 4 protein [Bacteroidales bacterium]